MSDHTRWMSDAHKFGWRMPKRRWFRSWPIVRHVWVVLMAIRVERHNAAWRRMGSIPTGFDEWFLYGVWNGLRGPSTRHKDTTHDQ